MTEWEQMKTEYHDVQIPANGPHQIQETIAKAKYDRNKNRRKKLIRYSATVAAMFLLVLLVPVVRFFSGGGSTENAACNTSAGAPATSDTSAHIPLISQNKTAQTEDSMESEIVEDTWDDSGNEMKQEAGIPGSATEKKENESAVSETEQIASGTVPSEQWTEKNTKEWSQILSEFSNEQKQGLWNEIYFQIKERQQKEESDVAVYEDWKQEVILEKAGYYISEDGLLVVVFAAGAITPESQEELHFVIPKEVIDMEERGD